MAIMDYFCRAGAAEDRLHGRYLHRLHSNQMKAETDVVFALTGDVHRNARALKQIRSLAGQGWSVHVLALKGDADVVEMPSGVHVETVELRHSRGFRFFREVHARMSAAALDVPASVYHASDLYVLPAMALAARSNGADYTYDSRELYPHVASTVGRPWVGWYWSYVEERYIRGSAAVFTVSRKIADHLSATYGIRAPVLVRNVPQKRELPEVSDRLARLAGLSESTPIILHLGQMRRGRGCETLVRAMQLVDRGCLVFLGYGPEKDSLRRLSESLSLDSRIRFLDPVPADDVLEVASGAHVGVTMLEDTCLNHRYALPNKLFDYLAAGVPVLAAHLPELRSVIQGYNVGRTVDPSDAGAVADALNNMIASERDRSAWIANAHRMAETFNWEIASQRFIRVFRSLLGAKRTVSNPAAAARTD